MLGKDGGNWLKKPGRPIFLTGIKMPFKMSLQQERGIGTKVDLDVVQLQLFNGLEDRLFKRPAE